MAAHLKRSPMGRRQVVTVATLLSYMATFPSMKACPALATSAGVGATRWRPIMSYSHCRAALAAGVFRTACLPSAERRSPPKARVRMMTWK